MSATGHVFTSYHDAVQYIRKHEEDTNNKYVTVKRRKRGKNICCQLTQVVGRPFVKRFAIMLSDRCLSCLSVTLVYCGQTVGRIKMKLDVQDCR